MKKLRPKIFCQFGDKPFIEESNGDAIGEIRLYRALSTFADVYYNDQLVSWDEGRIGHPSELCLPSRDYDLYYVRNNHDLFLQLPHPKVTMAYPYRADVFEDADAVVVTTQAWEALLRDHNKSLAARQLTKKWYPEEIIEPKEILNFQQAIDPRFSQRPPENEIFNWKARLTGARVFGFYGRVVEETIPNMLLNSIALVKEKLDLPADPLVAFAGKIRAELPKNSWNLGHVSYAALPALLASTFAILGQQCQDSKFLGSGKILDAMAQGVPIITQRNQVRIEQLGSDYPGMFDSQLQADELIMRLCTDDTFEQELLRSLSIRQKLFLPSSVGWRIQTQLKKVGLL